VTPFRDLVSDSLNSLVVFFYSAITAALIVVETPQHVKPLSYASAKFENS
jgi:hypothetical protein